MAYGMFGRRMPKIDPHLGMDIAREQGILPGDQPEVGRMPQLPGQQKKPGFFGAGGAGRGIAGTIGDFLLQHNGMAPIYAPQQQFQQALAERQRQASLERDTDWQDWVKREEYKRANPAPQAPDAFERALSGGGIDPRSEQGQQLYRQRAESMARDPNDEFVVVPIPGVGTYAGPKSGLAEAMGGQRQRNLGPVVDSIPGGGGVGNGPGNFRQ